MTQKIMKPQHILIVDDDSLIRKSLYEILKLDGHDVSTAQDGMDALDKLSRQHYNLILTDMKMPRLDGMGLLEEVKQKAPQTAVVLMTGYGTIDTAVEAIRSGAYDYVTKPVNDDEIRAIIQRLSERQGLVEENLGLKRQLDDIKKHQFCNLLGQNEKMKRIYDMIRTIAATRATVLIHGESGTGKRLIAQAIHLCDQSRCMNPFVEVSCAALPKDILESELFGHVKGSFTSAVSNRVGRFEMANGGTLLLDEIESFSVPLQVKLLRVLQERTFERVGESKPVKIDVRIIAATNRDLKELIRKGAFREDLYYRLNVISIHIPPLRDRQEDIPLLADHFLKQFNAESQRTIKGFSRQTMDLMMAYRWPGNVRELENMIERTVILAKGDVIEPDDLPEFLRDGVHPKIFASQETSPGTVVTGAVIPLKEALKEPERQVILHALETMRWNRKRTAHALGINRTTLYNKMKEYGLEDIEKGKSDAEE